MPSLTEKLQLENAQLREEIRALESHVTWMQTVGTEHVMTIRDLRKYVTQLQHQLKDIPDVTL
jgi:hypothetical protein